MSINENDVTLQRMDVFLLAMSKQITDREDNYLNDFHRKWNEQCMQENARVLSMRFSHAYMKAASDRMNALVRQEEERLKKENNKRNNSKT